jgi:hypothetical protein
MILNDIECRYGGHYMRIDFYVFSIVLPPQVMTYLHADCLGQQAD